MLNYGCVKAQKLVGGSRVDVMNYDCSHDGSWSRKIATTKGVYYRVFVKHDEGTVPATGTVGYAGSSFRISPHSTRMNSVKYFTSN